MANCTASCTVYQLTKFHKMNPLLQDYVKVFPNWRSTRACLTFTNWAYWIPRNPSSSSSKTRQLKLATVLKSSQLSLGTVITHRFPSVSNLLVVILNCFAINVCFTAWTTQNVFLPATNGVSLRRNCSEYVLFYQRNDVYSLQALGK